MDTTNPTKNQKRKDTYLVKHHKKKIPKMTQTKKKEARLDRGTLHTNIILRSRLIMSPLACLPSACLPALGNCCNKHKCVCCLTKKCTWTNSFPSLPFFSQISFQLIAGVSEFYLIVLCCCFVCPFFRLGLLSYSNEIVVIVFTWCVCLFVHFYQIRLTCHSFIMKIVRNSFYLMMSCLFDHFIRLMSFLMK